MLQLSRLNAVAYGGNAGNISCEAQTMLEHVEPRFPLVRTTRYNNSKNWIVTSTILHAVIKHRFIVFCKVLQSSDIIVWLSKF